MLVRLILLVLFDAVVRKRNIFADRFNVKLGLQSCVHQVFLQCTDSDFLFLHKRSQNVGNQVHFAHVSLTWDFDFVHLRLVRFEKGDPFIRIF